MTKIAGLESVGSGLDPVRVCHITKATRVSGSEKHLLALLMGLDKARYRVTLVLLVERNKPLNDYAYRFEGGPGLKIIAWQSNRLAEKALRQYPAQGQGDGEGWARDEERGDRGH